MKKIIKYLILFLTLFVYGNAYATVTYGEIVSSCGMGSGEIYQIGMEDSSETEYGYKVVFVEKTGNKYKTCAYSEDNVLVSNECSNISDCVINGNVVVAFDMTNAELSEGNIYLYINMNDKNYNKKPSYTIRKEIDKENGCIEPWCHTELNIKKYNQSSGSANALSLSSLSEECPNGYICSDIFKFNSDKNLSIYSYFRLIYSTSDDMLYLYRGSSSDCYQSGGKYICDGADLIGSKKASSISTDSPLSGTYSEGTDSVTIYVDNFNEIYSNKSFKTVTMCVTSCIKSSPWTIKARIGTKTCGEYKCVDEDDDEDIHEYIQKAENKSASEIINSTVDCQSLLGDKDDPKAIAYYLNMILQIIKYAALVILVVFTILDYIKAVSDLKGFSKANKNAVIRLILIVLLFVGKVIIDLVLDIFGIEGSCM